MTVFLRWLFGSRVDKPAAPDVLERLEALERGLRRVQLTQDEVDAELQRRFGKVWAALKALRNDDREAERVEDTPPAPQVTQADLLREHRARRFGGLLRHG